ncbi:MAG: HD domain-containing phosphohydrolase [Cellvibrio sp.]|uniref:HD domain-containing phosphohydrolase n=1 Tax=Cellvibrio sp. TaxID=1965322 RepID=UPI0031A7D771
MSSEPPSSPQNPTLISSIPFRISARLMVVGLVMMTAFITSCFAIGLQYYFSRSMAIDNALANYQATAKNTGTFIEAIEKRASQVASVVVQYPLLIDAENEAPGVRDLFAQIIRNNNIFYSLYLGMPNGRFYELINLENSQGVRTSIKANVEDRWVVNTVSEVDGKRVRRLDYFDAAFHLRTTSYEASDYDPRTRPWFKNAHENSVEKSLPYVFPYQQVTGQTYAIRLPSSGAVLGIDITLESFSEYLQQQQRGAEGEIFVYRDSGEVLASTLAIKELPYKELIDITKIGYVDNELQRFELNGEKYFAYVTPLGQLHNQPDYFAVVVPASKIVQDSLDRISVSIIVSGSCLLLLLPLCWLVANPVVKPISKLFEKSISVKERQYNQVQYHPSMIKEIDELSRAMVDMAASIRKHEQEQRDLMEAFIKLIAEAIDQKSPYTGGHCERVPELALMLVDAAVASTDPAFKDFSFASEEEYREFRIAAWLHDCGKITVPEHVADKGSKLEAIYNRIHEVRMRFEVLWRDAEIVYLKSIAEHPQAADQIKTELEQQRRKLHDDFAFIAKSNIGGEFFSQADSERLQEIAQITWERHFDNRLGLSPVEEVRFSQGDVALPVQEYLLADKPEHIIARTGGVEHHARYNIKMDVPEHLYNMGELHNLAIARGTLTPEDRFKINEHMISTIRMLEGLPFPAELARVPKYASTHHETMKGTGYPRKLKGEDLSIPERILAVADIFEALTAADRPYKKAKSMSESIAILHKMMLDEHIDRDVFELFLTSGTYMNYAQRFLAPAQIDEVDVQQYLIRK